MTFATLANIATMLFCLAVLVQSVRMMRSLRDMKDGTLTQVVEALDKSTAQARTVLSDLKATLGECAGAARGAAEAKELAEELGVMIGIADATAERLLQAGRDANRARLSEADDLVLEEEEA
jgi:hypothetical protein